MEFVRLACTTAGPALLTTVQLERLARYAAAPLLPAFPTSSELRIVPWNTPPPLILALFERMMHRSRIALELAHQAPPPEAIAPPDGRVAPASRVSPKSTAP